MIYRVFLTTSAEKEFGKAPVLVQKKIVRSLDLLAENPYVGKVLEGDLAGFRSVKAWPFRVVYEIVETKVLVRIVRIRHRKDAYK